MNLYKINVKYKAMNLHSKFYILFVHNRRKMIKNLTSESILRYSDTDIPAQPSPPGECSDASCNLACSRKNFFMASRLSPGWNFWTITIYDYAGDEFLRNVLRAALYFEKKMLHRNDTWDCLAAPCNAARIIFISRLNFSSLMTESADSGVGEYVFLADSWVFSCFLKSLAG